MEKTMEKKISEVLKEARELIADKSRWCTGDGAIDIESAPVDCTSDKACAWCWEGAVCKALGLDQWETLYKEYPELYAYMTKVSATMGDKLTKWAIRTPGEPVSPWLANDCMTHYEVIEMADLAIKLAAEDGK